MIHHMSAVASGYHVELIDGIEIEKPLPKKFHAIIQRFLLLVLTRDLPKLYIAMPELNVKCGADRLVPDVCVIERAALLNSDSDDIEAPRLAVEILSPGQNLSNVLDKCERLLRHGTGLCWIISPEQRQAWMYRHDHHNSDFALEAAQEKLAGDTIFISLADMWAELEHPQ
jgi:Uma2 family endonuclease